MKKILLTIVVVLLIAVAGVGIFLATFDADRHRPEAVRRISQALGVPVELGRLSLVWKNGLAARLQDLTVYTDGEKRSRSAHVDSLSAVVRLLPLLQGDIQVASVEILKPSLRLVRSADGRVGLQGMKAAPGAAPSHEAPSGAASPMTFSMDSFLIQDGDVIFEDRAAASPVTFRARDLDVKVKGFSLTKPFSFDAAAALFSTKQNVRVNGTVFLGQDGRKGYLKNAVLQSGLADWDLEALAKAVPAVAAAGLEGNLGGKLELRCEHADLDPAALADLKASVRLQNAAVKLRSIESPFENVQLAAGVSGGDLELENFSADFAKGTLKASGRVDQFMTRALSSIRLTSQDLAIDALMPGSGRGPRLGGRLSMDFEGKASGSGWPQISQTLSGQGNVVLKDGVLLNYNLLREVVQKLSIIPGAEGVLQERLPGIYKAKLGEPSTLLRPVELPFNIQNGQVFFDRFFLATDLLALQGQGRASLDGTLQARTTLRVERNLSGAMAGLLPQIDVLRNSQSEIEIPMQVHGKLPHVRAVPDKDYLVQKLLMSQAGQLVTGMISDPSKGIDQVRNLLDKPAAAGEAGLGFKNILQQALGRDSSSSAASNTGSENP